MNREQPDPDQTIWHRRPRPAPQPAPPPPEGASSTQRLPYTPDMLPDVPAYEAAPARSGWWWVILVGGIALLVTALAVGVVLWAGGEFTPW
ncbi:hypothetical protein [Nonomuraea sp. LPB2021202275-12-8]|uniref:hypothetical protein n=1 Tax=Nonomuraea sp. LPB2021202275-12-8 TaxID=3120159 RepID=UPI00300C83CD